MSPSRATGRGSGASVSGDDRLGTPGPTSQSNLVRSGYVRLPGIPRPQELTSSTFMAVGGARSRREGVGRVQGLCLLRAGGLRAGPAAPDRDPESLRASLCGRLPEHGHMGPASAEVCSEAAIAPPDSLLRPAFCGLATVHRGLDNPWTRCGRAQRLQLAGPPQRRSDGRETAQGAGRGSTRPRATRVSQPPCPDRLLYLF